MPPKQKLISQKNTRTKTEDRILGQPCALSGNVLPSYLEVGRAIKHKQIELQIKSGSTANPPFKDVRLEVATQIYAIWVKATIPCAKVQTIVNRIDDFWKKKKQTQKQEKS